MNPKLQRAYDALEQADAAGNAEDAQQIADYIRELQAQEEGGSADMMYPAGGAAIGVTTGAIAGPIVGGAVDTAVTKAAEKVTGPKGTPRGDKVAKWLSTQTTGPNVGGATFKEAFQKSETARGVPVQSRGSNIPIRKGFASIQNQPAEPSLPQKAAANLISSEKLGPPGLARRVGGMGVAGAEAGKFASDISQGNYGDAAVSGLGAIGGAMSQSRIKPVRAIGTGLSTLIPLIQGGKELKDVIYTPPPKEEPEQKAAGGLVHLAGGKRALAEEGVKAAHEYGGRATKKLSDWAQNYINQYLVPTQADRMGLVGGPSYSANQLALPQYQGRAWGSGNQSTASMISNLAKDPRFGGVENQIFTPILGKDTMHQSNKIVFDRMVEEFYKDPSKLTPELRAKINDYIQSGGAIRGKPQGFEPISNFDIADKEQVKELGNTFQNRGLIATHGFGGVDIGGRKAQIIPYNQILADTMDPTVAGAKTFSVGPRAFSLTGEVENVPRPDLNAAYPYQLLGKDLGVTYTPTPSELSLMDFHRQWRKDTGKTAPLKSGALPQPGYFEHTLGYKPEGALQRVYPRQRITEEFIKELQRSGHAEGGPIQHFDGGGKAGVLPKVAKHSISQYKKIAEALEEYLKGNITKQQQMAVTRQYLPIRQWSELPPEYTDEQIINALSSNQLGKALAPVPVGKETGNRLDINAYTKNNPPVFVDTVHDINDKNKVISYNRTGHLRDVDFKSLPNSAVLMGLGTKEQALTPMGAQMGKSKAPIAMIRGTNVGTGDNEVRRMMAEMLNDPNYTQIGMDPRVGSQFYDKATDRPIWTSGEKFQIGPLVMVPKKDIEVTDWLDPLSVKRIVMAFIVICLRNEVLEVA